MRLDTIPKIEQFIVDALLSSEQIPLGVNVMRLAAMEDEEGVARMARSIVVRYTGSTVNIENNVPVVLTRAMEFEVIHSAQSYLTESGHDYALKMCAGAYITLNSQVPVNVGTTTLIPFHMTSESFEGLSDSSHYTYVQKWSLEVKEIHKLISLDPCVLSGNCASLFPLNTIQTILPGDILYGNELYSPVLPVQGPLELLPYNDEFTGVEVDEAGSLVYTSDKQQTFITNWEDHYFTHTNTFDNSDKFLICHVRLREDDSIVKMYYAANPDDRRVIQIAGFQPGDRRLMGQLWKSQVDQSGLAEDSNGPMVLPAQYAQKNSYGVTTLPKAKIWADPSDRSGPTDYILFGVIHKVQEGTELVVDGETFVYIGGTRLGRAWVNKLDFYVLKDRELQRPWYCDVEVPEGDSFECD